MTQTDRGGQSKREGRVTCGKGVALFCSFESDVNLHLRSWCFFFFLKKKKKKCCYWFPEVIDVLCWLSEINSSVNNSQTQSDSFKESMCVSSLVMKCCTHFYMLMTTSLPTSVTLEWPSSPNSKPPLFRAAHLKNSSGGCFKPPV